MLSQILAITMLNLRSLGSRLGASMVIIIGIAGVVGVLIALLAMARGFEATLGQTGRDDRALVLRGGATAELNSGLSADQRQVIAGGGREALEQRPVGILQLLRQQVELQ